MVTAVPIPPDFRLALTIYKLSEGNYIESLREMCSLAKYIVCMIVSKTCTVITNTLCDYTVKRHLPTSEDNLWYCMGESGKEWQFPYDFAAADRLYLPTKCRNGAVQAMKQYLNFKGFYSIVFMVLVDAEYQFFGLQ